MGLQLSIEILKLLISILNDIEEFGYSSTSSSDEGDDAGNETSRSKSGSLREFLSDYENIVNGGGQGTQISERAGTGESGYRSESAYEETTSRARFGGPVDPVYSRSVCSSH
ncbi:unnamed protein product [Gongylonema pulchrum]|uniref:Uncharacterized protein n=1 Tax=Gongylonema pulchrum TaxID=637853 RepID=A0A183ENM4_9BILA|nr:unnamed protein product [Gongylonema pulchrum]